MSDGSIAIIVAVIGLLGATIASPLAVRWLDRRNTEREQIRESLVAEAARKASETVVRELRRDISTGNGSPLGPTVHRMEEKLDDLAENARGLAEVQHSQGQLLDARSQAITQLAGDMNDQRMEMEQFVAKVSPLCEWVAAKQAEEGAST